MRVNCISQNGKSLSDQFIRLGYTEQSEFSLSVGKEYEVYAMSLWCGVILLLLADEYHLPNWFPMELFSLSDPGIPADWSFLPSLANEKGLQALWGYERLITDASHYDGLVERDPVALRYFYEEECLRRRCD
jgi:hypothetical protein